MCTLKKKPEPGELLIHEYTEAWAHYRHVENDRTTYLKFFFTMLLASLGFLLSISKDIRTFGEAQPPFVGGVFLLLWFLNILTLFIFANIKQSGWVLDHYEKVWRLIRDMLLDTSLADQLDVRKQCHPSKRMGRWLFSAQKSAEHLLFSMCFLLDLGGSWLCWRVWHDTEFKCVHRLLMTAFQLIPVFLLLAGVWYPRRDTQHS